METTNLALNTVPEQRAIELKYLGHSHSEIAEMLGLSIDTIHGWFKATGKLFVQYNEFVTKTNSARETNLIEKLKMSDEEVYTITTNIGRSLAQRLQGEQIPMTDKDGVVQKDKDGNVLYKHVRYNPTVGDFVDSWKIQRIMQGLPVNYERSDMNMTQVSISMDVIITKLGLIDDDFLEENYGKTLIRITDYIRNNGGN